MVIDITRKETIEISNRYEGKYNHHGSPPPTPKVVVGLGWM
ncbi:MAG: hypothetical protein O4750_01020 [Trichodesmium sp. St18_bin3_1_1]|nr:hypothetical protein [Trichodesmium sp. St4_bin8_1]MDE5090401.1 hypothetical protein [Trichodesmium sp. St18_bin3_1_1]